MNILITSVGTRNKIVQYFKNEVGNSGKIIATDMNIFTEEEIVIIELIALFHDIGNFEQKNYNN